MTLTYERLHEVLKYTPFDGLFRWKINSNNHQVHIGDIAGTKSNGYIEISIDKKRYKAHRLAWFYVYGYMPEKEIDHIKRNKRDNRIRRLREASSQCQKRNIGIAKNNTSGVKGVSWYTKKKRWCAEIKVNKKERSDINASVIRSKELPKWDVVIIPDSMVH